MLLSFIMMLLASGDTFAVMARGSQDEGPYLNEVLDYYLNVLKFDKFYVLNTDTDKSLNWVKQNSDKQFRNRVMVHHVGDFQYEQDALNKGIAFLTEDWVFNVDFDEFLVLPKHNDIHSFAKDHATTNTGQFWFPWVLCATTHSNLKSTADIVALGCNKLYPHNFHWSGKRLLRRESIITGKLGVHDAETVGEEIYFPYKKPNIWDYPLVIHTATRGAEDLLQRVFRPYPKTLADGTDEVSMLGRALKNPKSGEMPYRFFIYAAEMALPKTFADANVMGKLRQVKFGINETALQAHVCVKLMRYLKTSCAKDRTQTLAEVSSKLQNLLNSIEVPHFYLDETRWKNGLCPRPLADKILEHHRRVHHLPDPPRAPLTPRFEMILHRPISRAVKPTSKDQVCEMS